MVPLGINLEGHGREEKTSSGPFTIGYLALIAPEKGLRELSEAYRRLRLGRNHRRAGFGPRGIWLPNTDRISRPSSGRSPNGDWPTNSEFHGELDRQEKIDFLHSLDVLSVPSPYDEPKGIYLLEAMANGVPVVQPRRGAFPEIVGTTGGGLLVEPDDPDALADGILSLWENPEKRAELSQRASQGVRTHFSVEKMALRALSVYQEIRAASTADHHAPGY